MKCGVGDFIHMLDIKHISMIYADYVFILIIAYLRRIYMLLYSIISLFLNNYVNCKFAFEIKISINITEKLKTAWKAFGKFTFIFMFMLFC
jgi:hypothetical protein